jgi:hypothetical protein
LIKNSMEFDDLVALAVTCREPYQTAVVTGTGPRFVWDDARAHSIRVKHADATSLTIFVPVSHTHCDVGK